MRWNVHHRITVRVLYVMQRQGQYSKDFKFTGWHPFCICIATPVMMDHGEFAEWLLGDGKIERDSISIQYSKDRTKELQNWAKQSLLNGSFSHKDFPVRVKMTGKSIKEFLNQPHKFKKREERIDKKYRSDICRFGLQGVY